MTKEPRVKKRRRLLQFAAVLIALLALWFLCVDRSWFVEQCLDCGYLRSVVQYRVFAIPVDERSQEYDSALQRIAHDLGVPCPHRRYPRTHWQRLWGLCYCAQPCITGTAGLTGGEWYDDEVAALVKAMASADPTLANEFRRRALYERDREYLRDFFDTLRHPSQTNAKLDKKRE